MKISTMFNITAIIFVLLLTSGVYFKRLPPLDMLVVVAFFLAVLSTQWFLPLMCAKYSHYLIKRSKNREAEMVARFGIFLSKPWDSQFFKGTNVPRHMTPSMSCSNFLRLALHNQGKFAEQQVIDRECLKILEDESGTSEGRGVAKAKLAASVHKSGDLIKALTLANESIDDLNKARLGERPNEVGNERFMAAREKALGSEKAHAYFIRATILESIRRYDAALKDREMALKIAQETFGVDSKESTPHMAMLGKVHTKLENFDKAGPILLKTLELREKLLAPGDKLISSARLALSDYYRENGELEKSEEMLDPAISAAEKNYKNSPGPAIGEYFQTAAFLRHKQGNKEKAEFYYRRTRETFLKYFPKNHPIFYDLNLHMIEFLTDVGKGHETEELKAENAQIEEQAKLADSAVK